MNESCYVERLVPDPFRTFESHENSIDLRPLLAGKSLMVFRLQTCHSKYATAAIGCEVGIRAVGEKQPLLPM